MRAPPRQPAKGVSWAVAIEAFLLVSDYSAKTRASYRSSLKRAGKRLGRVALASLTAAQLESFRSKVLAGPQRSREQELKAPQAFLVWASERGLVGLSPEAIRDALRALGAMPGVAWSRSARRRRRGPPPAADTLAAFGYPLGIDGLALVAEEIQGYREALGRADPRWWGVLVAGTDHPVNRRIDGGGVTAALAALREAAGGERGGADGFLAALGYAAGAAGERRLLDALRRLRAAFVAQQRRSLGRTIWRARWTEAGIALGEATQQEERSSE